MKTNQKRFDKIAQIEIPLPDGTILRATAVQDEVSPMVSIDLMTNGEPEKVCIVEFDPQNDEGSS